MDNPTELTYEYLKAKYGRTVIGKKELAQELNVSPSTLSLYISKGIGIPRFKRSSSAKNARLLFNIYDIAVYLNTDKIETM